MIDIQNRSSLDNYLNPPSFWYLSNSFDEFASVSQLWRQSLRRCLRWTAAATQLPGSPGRCETTDRRSPLGWERKTWWCWFSGDGWCSLSWCTAWRRSIVKNDPVHWVTGMIPYFENGLDIAAITATRVFPNQLSMTGMLLVGSSKPLFLRKQSKT